MGINRKRKVKGNYAIETIHHSFMTNLESIRIFVSNLAPIVKKQDAALIEKTINIFKKMIKIAGVSKTKLKKMKNRKIKPRLTEKQIERITDALKELPRLTPHNVELLYKSAFVMLISYFDFLISDLIHYFYQIYPESLSGKELSITLNELKLCNDISEGIEHIVNKQVENILYKSLNDQIKYFEDYLKIDCKKDIINWNKINEAAERRNIIVHNNSIVNRRYLKNVDSSVIPEKDLKEGRKISIDENYFMVVFYEIIIAGVILIQCCWRKWRKDDIDNADAVLIRAIYDALFQEKWKVAERLGLFSKECEVYNARNRLYLDINYCQSLKWQNKRDKLERELKKLDVSGLSPIYMLAISALKSDRDNFFKVLRKAITVDKLKKEDLMEWPLFREFRKDPDYEKGIKKAFMSTRQRTRRKF